MENKSLEELAWGLVEATAPRIEYNDNGPDLIKCLDCYAVIGREDHRPDCYWRALRAYFYGPLGARTTPKKPRGFIEYSEDEGA